MIMNPINRRTALRLGIPLSVGLVGMDTALAEPLDGKGNDVCPCALDIDAAVLNADGTIDVSGPCSVNDPPEEVTVSVTVRGTRGARAIGRETFTCEADTDSFSVAAHVRGPNRFEATADVTIHAKAHINPPDAPAITGRWRWTGELSTP